MKIKFFVEQGAETPIKKTDGAAGIDLAAFTDKPILIEPMQRITVPTGVYMELPKGYEAQIRPRSGLAMKHGITVLNSPGTIDSDYRGEIMVILINLSDQPFTILHGTRIAQMVIAKHQDLTADKIEIVESKEAFDKTERGNGGFGSTGA